MFTRISLSAKPCLALAALLAWCVLPSWAQEAPQSAPSVRSDVHHDVSPPLRELIRIASQTPPTTRAPHVIPLRHAGPLAPQEFPPKPDPVLQTTEGPLVSTTAGLNFDGVGANGSAPSDSNGAAGATQFVEWVNSEFAIYNKSTGALISGPTAGNTLWSGFGGGCETNNDGDIMAKYDRAAGRWVLAQFSVSTTPYLYCVAVSTTSDATGTFNRYSFSFGNTDFPDYPKMGIWPDAYYAAFNIFANGSTFTGADACAMDRNAMLAGSTATIQCFLQSSSVFSLLPSDQDGATAPPSGEPDFFLGLDGSSTSVLDLYKFHVDFTNPANSTFTGPTQIGVASYSQACGGGTCIPQSGTTQQLDSLGDRLMYRLAYRNFGDHEALVVNHSVTSGSSTGVRWYEIRSPNATPTLYQQGTFAPDSSYRWMGSIAMDQSGDIAVGYSVSSSSLHPEIHYTGRVPGDALGTMESEATIINGGGSQNGGLSRWGDYSSMALDPVDDCTFWYVDQYLAASGSFNWNTRIGSFKFTSCGGTTGSFAVSATPSSQTVSAGGSTTYTATVTPSGGFSGVVSFSASGLPSGASASFNPTSVTGSGSSTMTVTTSSSTPTGTYTLTITGTSGSLTSSTTVSLVVNASPNFSISATPSSQSVTQGGSTTYTATIAAQNGFTGVVSFSSSGLPSGASASFNPTSVTGSGSSTVTVSTSITTPTGTYTLTFTGTSGSLVHSATVSLVVTGSGGGGQTATYNSTLKAPECSVAGSSCDSGPTLLLGRDHISGGAEPNQPNTIKSACADGTSGVFHSDESNDRLVVATTNGSTLAPGATVTVTATVWAYSNGSQDALDLYYAANANSPTWTAIKTGIVPPAGGAQTLSATYTLPSGSLQAVRAQFRYLGSASSCTTGSYNDHDDLIFATGAGTAGFTVGASPSSVTVNQGSTATSTITVTSQNGFSSATTLTASGLPSGVTAAFSPNPVTPPSNGSVTSTLTFTASSSATIGTSNVTVTGTSGTLTSSTTISLTVSAPSSQLIINGGFETGTLSNWTAGGVYLPFVTTVQKHSGTYSAQLGSSVEPEPNGDSSIYQTIAIPSTATKVTLTFWYWPFTTDTIQYDWQEAQVQNTSGTTLAEIFKVASNAQAWTEVTYDLTSYKGQTIRIYFNDHEDGYGDLTYMYLDDVSVTSQ
ncbi:MAG TPA: hypothetical protein VGW33_01620 [Terriglobia bacterium]|nr:hypothetical protein [Terriglobia bacterium]